MFGHSRERGSGSHLMARRTHNPSFLPLTLRGQRYKSHSLGDFPQEEFTPRGFVPHVSICSESDRSGALLREWPVLSACGLDSCSQLDKVILSRLLDLKQFGYYTLAGMFWKRAFDDCGCRV